jgi:hypothetical protein
MSDENEILKVNKLTNNLMHEYIISSQIETNKENNLLKKEIKDLTNEKNSIEDDNERMEKSLINLKGFVKNFAMLSNLNKKLNKIEENNKKEIKAFYIYTNFLLVYDISFMCKINLILNLLLYILMYNDYISLYTIYTIYIILYTPFHIKFLFMNYNNDKDKVPENGDTRIINYNNYIKKYKNEINEIKSEIKEIVSGNAFLSSTMIELIELQ